jgi:serine/threonine-protein kinase HipA
MATELFVFAHLPTTGFVPAGRAELTETALDVEATNFAYGTRYLDRPESFEIEPVSLSLADRAAVKGRLLFPANGLPLFGGLRDASSTPHGGRDCFARCSRAGATADTLELGSSVHEGLG